MPIEPRSAVLQARITPSERDRAEVLAASAGKSLSDWCRDAILAHMGQPTEGDRIAALESRVGVLESALRASGVDL